MVKADKGVMQIEGGVVQISTEISMLLSELRGKDESIIPTVLACIYTDGGKNTLENALAKFKRDTEKTLEYIEVVERKK